MAFYRRPKTFAERREDVGNIADVRMESGEWGFTPALPFRPSRRVGRNGYGLPTDWDDLYPSRSSIRSWKDCHRGRAWTQYRPVPM